ncbi:uncharacterized protein LOC111519752 [Drosophila willistoni]|uniref:uncharacterized protein LOC111519752 n=1 Tax=Drosophila willistoni TaxID=7260 RepID=UPI000C26C587|nr:uncharacterized protein LOC111519752 [Drosophila willistoni]
MSLRSTSFSEFMAKVPTTRSAHMQARQIASKLLQHNRMTKEIFPLSRVPKYLEFRKLYRRVYGHKMKKPLAGSSTLPSSVSVYRSMVELRQAQLNRQQIKGIKSCIDTRPSHSQVKAKAMALDTGHLTTDFSQKQDIFRKNLMLLRRINRIQRLKGSTDCFNRSNPLPLPNRVRSRELSTQLLKENRQIGCRLLEAKSKVDCHNPLVSTSTIVAQKPSEEIVVKYSPFMPPPQLGLRNAQTLLRPVIYFDVAVRGYQPLGRIYIQLYTEVSPEVVVEFVHLATYNDVDSHTILRIFPDLWFEGELVAHERESLRTHHSRMHSPVDASQLTGILSYHWDYRQHFPQGLLNYSISFKPLAVVPLHRVVFGRVISGLRVLECCRDFGTKNGKTKKPLAVIQCGLI